jgi:hypothetical protein
MAKDRLTALMEKHEGLHFVKVGKPQINYIAEPTKSLIEKSIDYPIMYLYKDIGLDGINAGDKVKLVCVAVLKEKSVRDVDKPDEQKTDFTCNFEIQQVAIDKS